MCAKIKLQERPWPFLLGQQHITESGNIVCEQIYTGSTLTATLYFIYDAAGQPFALKYSTNGTSYTTYYYVLNLQGDVVGLINSSGSYVAKYTYDAWGNLLSVTNASGTAITSSTHIANRNPLRYRGYYYDTETGFYYLQSRYYDPVNHRFINADVITFTGQGFVGTNVFAYCLNDPITYSDSYGNIASPAVCCYTGSDVPVYIDDQDDSSIADIPIGWASVGHSGCGSIATYNALQTLDDGKSLEEIIQYYDENGDFLINGYAGMLPSSVANYFKNTGYRVEVVEFNIDNYNKIVALSQLSDASILWYTYPTDDLPYFGAHFVEFQRDPWTNGFIGHNVGAGRDTFNDLYGYAYSGSREYALGNL